MTRTQELLAQLATQAAANMTHLGPELREQAAELARIGQAAMRETGQRLGETLAPLRAALADKTAPAQESTR